MLPKNLTVTRLSFLGKYLRPHKSLIPTLCLSLLAGAIIQLIFPFLTQAVVDIGINTQNKNFIVLVTLAQIVLVLSRVGIEFIRSWILLQISTKINIALVSDFLIKLMRLPIAFFNSKHTGDIIQRIGDHDRIEAFLTSHALNFLFALLNLLTFGLVLAYYSL
ncbi:MAG: hypothetical protein HC877_23485 [Thioploca sp.]|nr:hypothetical protein [Thioploca sp.]